MNGGLRTVGDLMAHLQKLPDDVPLLLDGYEGGFTIVDTVDVRDVVAVDRGGDIWWLGEYDDPGAVEQESAGGWPHYPAPRVLGAPVTAVVLRRAQGR